VTESLMLLIPFLVLPVILLFAFAGCTGEDPELIAARDAAEKKLADEQKQQADEEKQHAADQEAAKYENIVKSESILVSFWRLDELETGSTIAKDSASVGPLDGEYKFLQGISRGQTGALALFKDPNDKAAQFKGTQGFVEVPYNGFRNPPFSFSVELWLLPEGTSTQPQVVIGSYELDPMGNVVRGFVLDVLRAPTLRIRARLGNDTDFTSLEAGLGDGSQHAGWRHVVMTYSGATKTLMLYVDADTGKADAQLPTPSAPAPVQFKAITNTAMPLRIGAGQLEVATGSPGTPPPGTVGLFFEGRIDEVALYRDVLEGATIKKHFGAA
jgi:hypothetical protein